MLLIRLEKVTKLSLKSLDSTNPQSDRWRKFKANMANVNVHEPTIRRTLSNHGVHAELQEENHCSPKRELDAKDRGQARGLLEKDLMDG